MNVIIYALIWCSCLFAGEGGVTVAPIPQPIGEPTRTPLLSPEPARAANAEMEPLFARDEDEYQLGQVSASTLRDMISLLNLESTFALAETPVREELSPTEQKLYDIFGPSNYIQLFNPEHASINTHIRVLVDADPTITDEQVLRYYIAQRGIEAQVQPPTPIPTPAPAPAEEGAASRTPARPERAPRPVKPPSGASSGGTPSKPPVGAPLDLKPINDATGKLNSALTRIRNAKDVKISVEQRTDLKKEADKLLKENNPKLKLIAERIQRILAEPNFNGNPDKVAPFKRFADIYFAVEREVKSL